MSFWSQLQQDLEAIHIMRNRIHDVIFAVPQCAVQSKPTEEGKGDRQHPSRINVNEVGEVNFSSLTEESFADSYQCEKGPKDRRLVANRM